MAHDRARHHARQPKAAVYVLSPASRSDTYLRWAFSDLRDRLWQWHRGASRLHRVALDDDAILAAVRRVRERGQPVDSFRVAVELQLTDERGDPDHTTVEEALRQLVSDERLMHRPVIVEWTTNPDSREVLDFYRPMG